MKDLVNFLCWIRGIVNDHNGTPAEFVCGLLGGEDITLLLGAKRPLPSLIAPHSPFYAQILKFWVKVHDFPPEDEDAIRREVLWENQHIPSAVNMLPATTWKRWSDAGIFLLNHVCHRVENRILGQQELLTSLASSAISYKPFPSEPASPIAGDQVYHEITRAMSLLLSGSNLRTASLMWQTQVPDVGMRNWLNSLPVPSTEPRDGIRTSI